MNKIIKPSPCCNFCGGALDQVQKLVRGRVGGFPSYICDGCVVEAYSALGLVPAIIPQKKIHRLVSPFPERAQRRLKGMAAANAAVDVMIKTITAALAAGENVEINSFGKFVHVNGRRHVGRNFKTGETIDVSPRRSVIFRLAKELRQAL